MIVEGQSLWQVLLDGIDSIGVSQVRRGNQADEGMRTAAVNLMGELQVKTPSTRDEHLVKRESHRGPGFHDVINPGAF